MCGIAGWINFKENLHEKVEIMRDMRETLSKRGPDQSGEFFGRDVAFVHRRLAVVDLEGGLQPMSKTVGKTTYTMVYNGELYNTEELRGELLARGYEFEGTSDTEVLLFAFIEWGRGCLRRLNGIFAFAVWNSRTKSVFIARDPMGVKPLFYKVTKSGVVFASELKALFRNPLCTPVLDKKGVNEIFLLAPARIPSSGVYRGIKSLERGEYLVCDRKNGVRVERYFRFRARKHRESFEQTVEHLRDLTVDAIEKQLVADVPLATFLSGGLDSSIITYVASRKYEKENRVLATYSVDFRENDKHFQKNAFQPDRDEKYINILAQFCKTAHEYVTLDNAEVVDALLPASRARDLGGMADIDSSLLLFCNHVKRAHTVCLSGECADELFGGYPWFFNKCDPNTFPWMDSIELRRNLVSPKYVCSDPEKFVREQIERTYESVEVLPSDTSEDIYARRMFMLNVDWFMQTLLERKDRMSMYNGLEVRVPFCDTRLAQYAYNIPWSMKALEGREKGLMRKAFEGILPDEIVYRKKNPYPKTFDPEFLRVMSEKAIEAVRSGGVLSKIINHDYFDILVNSPPSDDKPFYGQLMRLPQIYAWLWQIDNIFREYNVKLV